MTGNFVTEECTRRVLVMAYMLAQYHGTSREAQGRMDSQDDVRSRLADIRRLLNAATHRRRYYEERTTLRQLPRRHRRLVQCTVALTERGSGAAGLMWRHCQRCRGYADRTLRDLEEDAHDEFFLGLDGFVDEELYNSNPESQRIVKRAARFAAELEVFLWVTQCNVERGVAPQAHAVLRRYQDASLWNLVLEEARHSLQLRNASLRYQLVWLFQFRKRWGCAVQRLKVENVLEPFELQTKAWPPR